MTIPLPSDLSIEDLQPIGGFVVIEPREVKPKGMIIAPDGRRLDSDRGTIILVSDGVDEVRPGQDVLFAPYSQRVLELNGVKLFMVHESDILAVLEAV